MIRRKPRNVSNLDWSQNVIVNVPLDEGDLLRVEVEYQAPEPDVGIMFGEYDFQRAWYFPDENGPYHYEVSYEDVKELQDYEDHWMEAVTEHLELLDGKEEVEREMYEDMKREERMLAGWHIPE